ncbi:VQ motif-containing protein 4 [Linum perenne]
MEKSSPRFHHHQETRNYQTLLPSPNSTSSSSSRSDSANPYPTTFVQADTSSFKQVVQMLTGSPKCAAAAASPQPDPNHKIPPIKSIPKRNQSSGFKLYERRNSLKNLKINPLNPFLPEILSPSILDFPSLVLSPVTPLIHDPFDRSGSGNNSSMMVESAAAADEEKAIKEKGFYLHASPATTPREAEPPRLLPLFPVTSPRVSGSE